MRFTQVDPHPTEQSQDGMAFFARFDRELRMNFVWDGFSDHMEVEVGGSGEPVKFHVPVPQPSPRSARQLGPITLGEFAEHVDALVAEMLDETNANKAGIHDFNLNGGEQG